MQTVQVILFLILGTLIGFISRASLRNPRSHGFYRFFAWEIILILFLKNIPVWFNDPLAWHQLISWFLLAVCCIPVILGVLKLRQARNPRSVETQMPRPDGSLFEFERTTRLVTTGVYQYIRHPLYSSLLLLAWGIFFKHPDWIGVLLAAAASAFLLRHSAYRRSRKYPLFWSCLQ